MSYKYLSSKIPKDIINIIMEYAQGHLKYYYRHDMNKVIAHINVLDSMFLTKKSKDTLMLLNGCRFSKYNIRHRGNINFDCFLEAYNTFKYRDGFYKFIMNYHKRNYKGTMKHIQRNLIRFTNENKIEKGKCRKISYEVYHDVHVYHKTHYKDYEIERNYVDI